MTRWCGAHTAPTKKTALLFIVIGQFFEAVYYTSDIMDPALIHEEVMEVGQEFKTQAIVEMMVIVGVRVRR